MCFIRSLYYLSKCKSINNIFNLKDYQSKVWSYLFVMALVDIILGIVIVINPFPSSELNLYLASLIVISEFLVFMQNILVLFGVKNDQKDK